MSFFYYLRKLTSFTHGWLLSLRLCSFLFLSVGLSVCYLLLVYSCCFIEFVLAVVCVEFWRGRRLLWWRVFECIVFSRTRKGGGACQSRRDWFGFPEKEQGCCIRERCPVGSLIVGAMMTRWLFGMCVDHCLLLSYVCVFSFLWMLSRRDGDFLPRRKSVFVCFVFFVYFFLLRVQ